MDEPLEPQPRRFHDGGPVGGHPDPQAPPTIVLERTEDMPAQAFRLTRRIAYRDRRLGELVVPADPATFVTDLTSVPSVFGWLVPRTGEHLPAALIHDGLVGSTAGRPTHVSTEGHVIDTEAANRVFRDAMADTGTGVVRRWLMWTAVTLATMVTGAGTHWSAAERWRWRATAVGSLLLIAVLGVMSTADLLDVDLPLVGGVPWMDEGSWWARLATGAAGAVVTPIALGLLWGRFRIAGVIAGIALALLLHVTAAVALLTGVYQAIEWLCARALRAAMALAGVLTVIAAVVLVVAW